jgi:tRNA (cmo5U34)-methyltransferase
MGADEVEETEPMAEFFNTRAVGYDAYIQDYVFEGKLFSEFYEALSAPIPETPEPLQILDLGCGTGLELEALFARAPNALITGVDVAGHMLDLLRERYAARMSQITLVQDSYLTMDLGTQSFDYVISAMANHHLLHGPKRQLYERVHAALRPGGKFIEGDSVTLAEAESEFLAEYDQETVAVPPAEDGHYHIDVPLSMDSQKMLLLEAGFRDFGLIWQRDPAMVWNIAVYVVTK